MLNTIMETSRRNSLTSHEINLVRRDNGLNPASQVWFWGQGHAPNMPSFDKKYGVKSGCMITSVDLLRGLGTLLGWQNHEVPGMTSFHDTNYKGQGEATAAALDEFDIVVSHVEAPDEASHQADIRTKVASIEAIDKHIVGAGAGEAEDVRSVADPGAAGSSRPTSRPASTATPRRHS